MDTLEPSVRVWLAAPLYCGAYAIAAFVFWRMAVRRGLATTGMRHVLFAGLIGGLLGANLVQLLFGGVPGKAIEGGIAGGWLAVVLVKRFVGIVRPTGDLFAPALSAGEAMGRIGCFVGGCCYGRATTAMLAVHDHGAFRYPTQLYASAYAALTLAVLLWLERRRVLPESGLFYIQGLLFCLGRFALDFVRDAQPIAGGLTAAQLGCAIGAVVFAALAVRAVPQRALSPA